MLLKLGENDIKTVDDFAGLASDELTDPGDGYLAEFELSEDIANELIMKARVAEGWLTEEEAEEIRVKAAADAAANDSAPDEPAIAG
jgi:N utilization substance protein A